MALYKRGKMWWIIISHHGKRVQQSTGTTDRIAAQRLHDKIKSDLWKKSHLDEKPERTWMEAVSRWLLESQHKKSLKDDKIHLRWLDPHLKHFMLNKISRDLIDNLAEERLKDNVKPATVNRMLEIIRNNLFSLIKGSQLHSVILRHGEKL